MTGGAFPALLEQLRPRQWVKNSLLFAAALFTLDQGHGLDVWLRVLGAFAVFCALSSATYILNDLCDLEQDRKHPRKRGRPLASGRVSPPAALGLFVLLAAGGIATGAALGLPFLLAALSYMALTALYSFWLKHQVILDVLALALGFVVRAVAGALVIAVEISPWLLVCTILGALFLGLAKRRAEIRFLEADAAQHRRSLGDYSVAFLDQLINIVASATLVAYCLYTFFSDTASEHPLLMLTIPFVIYGLFRFLFLVHRREVGGDPTSDLLGDRPLMLTVLLWALTAGLILWLNGG